MPTMTPNYIFYIVDYPPQTYSYPTFSFAAPTIPTDVFPFWYKRDSDLPIQPTGILPTDPTPIYFDDLYMKFTINVTLNPATS